MNSLIKSSFRVDLGDVGLESPTNIHKFQQYDSREGIEDTVVGYFQRIFKMHGVLNNALQEVLVAVSRRVTPEMNEVLLQLYSAKEIRVAVFQTHPSKLPGPDGMSPLFYQRFWHVVGLDVVEAVWSFLQSGHLGKEICYTHVVFVPKVN